MNILAVQLTDIIKTFGNKTVLEINHLSAYFGDRIGIIGDNGSGKTTLLRLISGEIEPEDGIVNREIEFNYFKQIDVDLPVMKEDLDYKLLSQFSVPNTTHLSGGEQSKLRLTDVLSEYQMGLLLDEPTTHLDYDSVQVLIKELEHYYGTLIFVSHNREFLNRVANTIWEVKDSKVDVYPGNYENFLEQKEIENKTAISERENLAKEKAQLEHSISKQRAYANEISNYDKNKSKTGSPGILGQTKSKDTVQKRAYKKVKALESRLGQLKDMPEVITEQQIHFPVSKRNTIHNKFPIISQGLSVIRGDKTLLKDATFQFEFGKTLSIIGPNGSGKSSFLNEILNNNTDIEMSPKVRIGAYGQFDYNFTSNKSVIDYLKENSEFNESFLRNVLYRIGFNETDVEKSVNAISGGEATRLSLALLFTGDHNVLLLDEPTNFIDLTTIKALESFIKGYEGLVIITSHDMEFVRKISDKVYEIKGGKLIEKDLLLL